MEAETYVQYLPAISGSSHFWFTVRLTLMNFSCKIVSEMLTIVVAYCNLLRIRAQIALVQ